jgi:lysophospholipase L1-like esterase
LRGGSRPQKDSTVSPPKKGDKYVALGSSIASGFGISVQSTSCGRSSRSYGQLIAARYKLELVDVSCGAALISNVVDTPQGENPPQIAAVTPDTKLITVSIGGNDILYNGIALGCGDPATDCTAPADLDARLASAETALSDMLDQLEAAAPKATIVFVTYPREVPRTGNCPELSYTDEEAETVRSMGEQLEAMFVAVAKRRGIVFVDPYVARGDHTGCAPASKRWTAGNVADDGFAYHPTALGHEVMATMINKALRGD